MKAVQKYAESVGSKAGSRKMTKEQYLLLCESMGYEPEPDKIPIEWEDFPYIVQLSHTIYNNLSDNYIPGDIPIFTGKNISGLPVLFDIYEITSPSQKELILQIINILDSEAVKVAKKRAEKALKGRKFNKG